MGFLIVSALSLISFSTYVRGNHNDCSQALEICELGDYHIPIITGYGVKEKLGVNNSKIEETYSHWFQFEAAVSGNMEFIIVPDNSSDDFDFILYEGFKCDEKTPERIMTSGEVIGTEVNVHCIGQTGLQSISDDIKESDGCFDFDDNFLKPAFLEKGKSYYLLVNNFNSIRGFTILFSGDDNLELVNNCQRYSNQELEIDLFPNPTPNLLTVSLNKEIITNAKVQIFDQSGKLYINNDYDSLSEKFDLDVSSYPSGKYFIRITNESEGGLNSFIKI